MHFNFRQRLAALAAWAVLSAPAWGAATATADYSDLWWNASENGWGVQLQQQDDVIFMTLYVYAADGAPEWFVASDMRPLVFVGAAPPTWQGALYRTSGPAYAGGFDPHSVTQAAVGTATVEFSTDSTATLRYSVDGTEVVKSVTRLTWRSNPPAAGAYNGGMSVVISSCPEPDLLGTIDLFGAMTTTVAGSRVTMAFSSPKLAGLPSSCTFGGDYRQDGRLGTITGNFSCSLFFGADDRGEAPRNISKRGSFTIRQVEVSSGGVYGKLSAVDQDCKLDGYIGGVRLP